MIIEEREQSKKIVRTCVQMQKLTTRLKNNVKLRNATLESDTK